MGAGTALMANWVRRLKSSPFLIFSGATKCVRNDAMAGMYNTAEDFPGVNWKLRMSCAHWFVTSRNSFTDGEARKKKKIMPLQERKMIDKFRLHVRGGEGGAGCSSFRKSRHSRHGSADGGNGGRGGDVILVSSLAVWDLSNLQHHLNGTRGGPGSSKKRAGSRGMDKIVQVPVGTVIHIARGSIPTLERVSHSTEDRTWEDLEGVDLRTSNTSSLDITQHVKTAWCTGPEVECLDTDKQDSLEDSSCHSAAAPPCSGSDDETSMSSESLDIHESEGDGTDHEEDGSLYQKVQSSVAEFTKVGQSFIVACGGDGGKGNAAMARGRGSEKGLPSFEHEQGQLGSEAHLILELKTIADVGLVGAPNAGKSTLLGSLSMAKPTIGHYKFTTLRPNIGMLDYEDFFNLTVADIPGLIEGAHENRGLGHAFLRHIERTKVLAYVIDLAGGIGDDTGPLPWDQFEELVSELEKYQKGLSQRPSIIVANKIDEEGALAALQILREKVPFLEIYPVCAVLEEGVDTLKLGLRKLVEASRADSLPLSQPRDL